MNFSFFFPLSLSVCRFSKDEFLLSYVGYETERRKNICFLIQVEQVVVDNCPTEAVSGDGELGSVQSPGIAVVESPSLSKPLDEVT